MKQLANLRIQKFYHKELLKFVNMNKQLLMIVLFLCSFTTWSQRKMTDSINNVMDKNPAFTIFRDNYFITGGTIESDRKNSISDAKYQISFKNRLTKSKLLFNSSLFFTYTQKSFWRIYDKSSPFAETNYNPSVGLSRFSVNKKKLINLFTISFEHESNGRDSIYSRSWNRITLNYVVPLSKKDYISFTGWLPLSYKQDNPELIQYVGYGEITYIKTSPSSKFLYDLTIRKGTGRLNYGSIQAQIYYRIGKTKDKFIMAQYYNGFAESLINFNKSTNIMRFGFVFHGMP
jgi:phospholipase A1/A2